MAQKHRVVQAEYYKYNTCHSYRSSKVIVKLTCHRNRKCLDVIELRGVGILNDFCVMISKIEETVNRVRTGLNPYERRNKVY